jgi:hypothetical protein
MRFQRRCGPYSPSHCWPLLQGMKKYSTAGRARISSRVQSSSWRSHMLPSHHCTAKNIGVFRSTASRQAHPSQAPAAAAATGTKAAPAHVALQRVHVESQSLVAAATDKTSGDGSGGGAVGLDDRTMGELAHMRLLVMLPPDGMALRVIASRSAGPEPSG